MHKETIFIPVYPLPSYQKSVYGIFPNTLMTRVTIERRRTTLAADAKCGST